MVQTHNPEIQTEDLQGSNEEQNSNSTHSPENLPQEPLYGRELLQAVENMRADKSEKAIRTGHYTVTENGTVRAKNTQFLEALCEAKSIPFKDKGGTKRGRNATYYTKVQQPGSITVGRRYIEEWGLRPGDPVKIEVKRKQLILRKLEDNEIEEFNKREEEQERENQEEMEISDHSTENGHSPSGEISQLVENDEEDDIDNEENDQTLDTELDW